MSRMDGKKTHNTTLLRGQLNREKEYFLVPVRA